MKRDDPKLFGPTGAGKNEIRMEQKEDEEDDDEEDEEEEEDEEDK